MGCSLLGGISGEGPNFAKENLQSGGVTGETFSPLRRDETSPALLSRDRL